MTENPQPPSSDTEKLLAKLEAEREKRIVAGAWSRASLPMLQALVGDDETDEQAMERALAEHLKEHPGDPKSIHAYDWILRIVIHPKPQVELPSEQYAPDHADAIDVTPRRPSPSPSTRSARSLAPPKGALDPRNVNIPRDIAAAERRRTQRFMDDEWGSPADHPLRYPRGNRSGW